MVDAVWHVSLLESEGDPILRHSHSFSSLAAAKEFRPTRVEVTAATLRRPPAPMPGHMHAPPSLPPADDIAKLLEDEISDADGFHHVEQRPSYYEAYESEAQLESDDALWPQTPIHSPPPPSLLLTDHVSELRKDEILGAGK